MKCPGKRFFYYLSLIFLVLSCPAPAFSNEEEELQPTPAFPDDFFIDLVVPSHRLYLGEVIRIEYDVYVAKSRGIVHYDNREPDFDAWFTFEDEIPEPSQEQIEGKTYTKEPYAAYFVAPLKPGKLVLPTLFVTIPYLTPTPWVTHAPHTVEVLLPPEPYPAEFDLHNVGNIRLEADIPEDRVLEAGKTFSYTLKVISNTPTDGITITMLDSGIPENAVRFYPLKKLRHSEKHEQGQFQSVTEYRATVAPLIPGSYMLPATRITYFDPKSQHYKTTSSSSFEIIAMPSMTKLEDTVMLSSLELDTAKPRPITINTPSKLPLLPRWFDLFPIVVTAVGVFAYRDFKRRKKRQNHEGKIQYTDELYTNFKEETAASQQLAILHQLLSHYLHTDFDRTVHLEINTLRDHGLSIQDALQLASIHDLLTQANYSNQNPLTPQDIEECVRILKLLAPKE